MTLKEAFKERIQAQVKSWEADIAKLRAQANIEAADARISYHTNLERASEKLDDLKVKLREFTDAGESAAQELQSGIERAIADVTHAIDEAKKCFTSKI